MHFKTPALGLELGDAISKLAWISLSSISQQRLCSHHKFLVTSASPPPLSLRYWQISPFQVTEALYNVSLAYRLSATLLLCPGQSLHKTRARHWFLSHPWWDKAPVPHSDSEGFLRKAERKKVAVNLGCYKPLKYWRMLTKETREEGTAVPKAKVWP